MRKQSISLLNKGQGMSFIYNGGSRPNTRRNVYVYDVKSNHFIAFDFDEGAVRNFSHADVRDMQQLDGSVINMLAMPTSILPGKLVEDLRKDGRYALYDATNTRVVSFEKPKQQRTPRVYAIGNTIVVTNGKKECSIFAGATTGQLYLNGDVTSNPQDIVDAITAVLNG